jgi:phage-related tail fiber protein
MRRYVGEIIWMASERVPDDCLTCEGQAVSRSTYSELFDAIGTLYGVGDGSTTFNLPEMRLRFPVGIMRGFAGFDDPGDEFTVPGGVAGLYGKVLCPLIVFTARNRDTIERRGQSGVVV